MKKLLVIAAALLVSAALFAQESDDDFFFDDDDLFFDDDGIVELDTSTTDARTEELSHGSLFEAGSIKIGGSFNTSISTSTVLYSLDDEKTFKDHLKDTTLTPTISATLSVDARPTQTLRMYTKFGLAYPFKDKITVIPNTTTTIDWTKLDEMLEDLPDMFSFGISNWFSLNELFTDFSIADRAFFRFGLHTVSWGTGYFFSPVSDMINTSSINPEDVTAQVRGSVNLRTQITFPGTQDCLWLYVIPSTKFNSAYTAETYIKDTALAAKGDLVFGGWEFGVGGFYKYQNAPKAMITASGSIIHGKVSVFGEAVYQYGADTEWADDNSWKDKTSLCYLTAGAMYLWKKPQIMLAAQYYYDSNDKDMVHSLITNGHNIALVANFGKIYKLPDVTSTVFGMVNIGREDMTEDQKRTLDLLGISPSLLSSATISAMVNYTPFDALVLSAGPYITWENFDSKPVVSLKITAKLGGGKF